MSRNAIAFLLGKIVNGWHFVIKSRKSTRKVSFASSPKVSSQLISYGLIDLFCVRYPFCHNAIARLCGCFFLTDWTCAMFGHLIAVFDGMFPLARASVRLFGDQIFSLKQLFPLSNFSHKAVRN